MSLQNEYSDSSSDESVCFGPYTIQEAKKDIRKCVPKKINTRHSSMYQHYDISQEIQALTAQLVESTISSSPSNYQTADETASTEEAFKNSEFLEKLTKVINEPVSGSTSYNTAFDQEDGSSPQKDALEVSILTISDDSSSQLHSPAYEFITNDDLEKSESPVMTHMAERCQELITEAINDEFEAVKCDDVLDISYSSLEVEEEDEDCDFKVLNMSKPKALVENIEIQGASADENILDDSSDSDDEIPPTPQENHVKLFFNYKQLSKISEKSEFTTYLNSRPSTDRATPTEIAEINIQQHSTSPVQVPEINLNQFDDSCDFDDTLEEMNRFLEQGTDYVMPEKTTPAKTKASPDKQSFSPKDFPKEDLFTSRSDRNNRSHENLVLEGGATRIPSLNAKKMFYSAEKVFKPSAEVTRPKTTAKSKFHHAESKVRKPIPLFPKSPHHVNRAESAFKVPSKPAKKLLTPSKVNNLALKNVVSPVGLYINHGPKYHPMVKASPGKPLFKTKFEVGQPGPSSYKENIPASQDMEFPSVIYKPAKFKCATEAPDVNLPGNIRKLISPQVVTKHERRIQTDTCNQSIERRLLESNLSIDVSQCNDEDISILTHKQPFNMKF